MIILAMRGQGKNLVFDRNSIVKKWKFENFDQNSCYILQKKAKNMYNANSGRKSMICYKTRLKTLSASKTTIEKWQAQQNIWLLAIWHILIPMLAFLNVDIYNM